MGEGGMKGVGGGAVAGQFGDDFGPTGPGVLELLEDEDRGALGEDEAVAVAVEGPGGDGRA